MNANSEVVGYRRKGHRFGIGGDPDLTLRGMKMNGVKYADEEKSFAKNDAISINVGSFIKNEDRRSA